MNHEQRTMNNEPRITNSEERTTTNTIPLRKVVLYKHGMGYFTREGIAGGTGPRTTSEQPRTNDEQRTTNNEIVIPFKADEIDDALKSLIAIVPGGGRVMSIGYRTPEERIEPPVEIPFALGRRHALFDLFRNLRGTRIEARLEGSRTVEGRLIGIEEHPQGRKRGAMVILATGNSAVEQVASDRITQIRFLDDRASANLARLLDADLAARESRDLRIVLSEPGCRVQVSYSAPAAVWRVSYRLVAESGDGDAWSCLLQGWAIFDNRLDEDLDGVEVTLVAGRPISFRYDLATSLIPERRLLREESRVASGPIELETAIAAAVPTFARMASSRSPVPLVAENVAASIALTGGVQDRDELFEYRLGAVTVRRGESAMVPIVQHNAPYRRKLLYNSEKQALHPIVSMCLLNDTGLTLERGPITIVEDGEYRGEAILPFSKPGAEIALAYAVELGIRVTEETREISTTAGLELRGAYLHVQEHLTRETAYGLTNDTGKEQVVSVERRRLPGWEPIGAQSNATNTEQRKTNNESLRQADEETSQHRRWDVVCPAGKRVTLTVAERRLVRRQETVLDQDFETLARYLETRSLEKKTRSVLASLLKQRQAVADLDHRMEGFRAEQAELAARQDRLRQNLAIEATSEAEVEIRRRSSEAFLQAQDREERILIEIARLNEERETLEQDLERELASLA
jgi:hypothetical protein